MTESDFHQRVAAVRRFNRFYTAQIGVLHEGLLQSPFTLTEARVLYELAHRDRPIATELVKELGLDAGYLSRILRGFTQRGLVARASSTADGRQTLLSLTQKGRGAFAPLDRRSREEVGAMLSRRGHAEQARLTQAMSTIEEVLSPPRDRATSYLL